MKKILEILICILLIATAVPAVTSENKNMINSVIPTTQQTRMEIGWSEIQKLLASDGAIEDYFGGSVSLSWNTALIGAKEDDDYGDRSGSAYVFTRTGTTWTQQQKLHAPDGRAGDQFGNSVSLSGDTALIGAYFDDDNGGQSGSAYVFIRSGNSWTLQAKLLASDGAEMDFFGGSVTLSGDTALIGSPLDDDNGDDSGSAYVFIRNGNTWTQQAKLLASDGKAGELFGGSVSLSGDTALIGKYEAEAAYVFTRTGTTWKQQQKLLASDSQTGDGFGKYVSLDSDTALIGAPLDDDNGSDSGSAYVFTRSGTTWTQQQKLTATDGANGNIFGSSVSISGDTALIGAAADDSGSAYVFTRTNATWVQQQKLLASDGVIGDYFGVSVCLSGATALIGANEDDDNGESSGSAYVFIKEQTNQPPTKPIINGQISGKVKKLYDFELNSTDPDEDNLYYFIDWGDQTNSGWIGSYPSGDVVIKSHSWLKKGTYTIKAKAKDSYGNESDWGTLIVTMACSYNILDPGWIRGPIWGRIDGYEFRGTDNHATLLFYAKNVHYFGIGHAFNAGLYPRHWVNEEVSAYYSYFEGSITEHIIFGKISGLPNQ